MNRWIVILTLMSGMGAQAAEYKCTVNREVGFPTIEKLMAEDITVQDDAQEHFYPTNNPKRLIAVSIRKLNSPLRPGATLIIATYGVNASPNPVVTNNLPYLAGTFYENQKWFQFNSDEAAQEKFQNIDCELLSEH